MKANVGGIDQILRIVVGIALIITAGTGLLGAWAWIGVIPLATGLMRFCPLYPILGISSCAKK
jgi:hypothetical protein